MMYKKISILLNKNLLINNKVNQLKKIVFLVLALLTNFYALTGQKINFSYNANGSLIFKKTTSTFPKIVIMGDTISCSGNNITITANGAQNYRWSNGDTGETLSVIVTGKKTYSVIGYNALGCSDTAYFTVQPVAIPQIDSITGKRVSHPKNIDTFSVPFYQGSFYSWTITNGVILSGYGSNKIVVQWDDITGQGTVKVVQSVNNNQCSAAPIQKNVLLQSPSSVSSLSSVGSLKVYPNPTEDGVWIDFNPNVQGTYTLSVLNIEGKRVYKKGIDDTAKAIFLERTVFPASGVYFITISSAQGDVSQKIEVK